MKFLTTSLSLTLFLALLPRRNVTADSEMRSEDGVCSDSTSEPCECKLYIAPSTIPNAGLGIFTAVPVKKDEVIGYGDVILPIMELDWNMGTSEFFSPFSEYVWDSWTLGMGFEASDPDSIDAFSPGTDCAINCNLALVNVDRGDFEYQDQVGGHRGVSPSAGSMTPYHNGSTYATEDIGAGDELFKFYSDNWFITRTETFGYIPLYDDYPKAERLLRRLRNLENKLELSEEMRTSLYTLIYDKVPKSRIMNALPRDYESFDKIVTTSMRSFHQTNATRSVEELKATGRCFDNIEAKESTLPYAGRGAFATRRMPKGSTVTGSPLIHVPSEKLAFMYEKDDKQGRDVNSFAGFQLWYNYCMSHRSSSILLCPYGSGINYINHNQSLANIKIQWPPHGEMSHDESWFKRPSMDADYEYATHLGMDYVATRDIQKGDELLMDYGNDWEQAWQEHLSNWEPSDEDKAYISATQWNSENAEIALKTVDEQEATPYPSNLLMRCDEVVYKDDESWYKKESRPKKEWESWDKGHACIVLRRNEEVDGSITYNVKLTNEEEGVTVYRNRVPRDLIIMIDERYTTDWHMLNAFRHCIGIPDEMFPQAWMDKVE